MIQERKHYLKNVFFNNTVLKRLKVVYHGDEGKCLGGLLQQNSITKNSFNVCHVVEMKTN